MKQAITITIFGIILIGGLYFGNQFLNDNLNGSSFIVGDKVRYTGSISSAHDLTGWIVDIQLQFDTPYMIAFTKNVNHAEEVAIWKEKKRKDPNYIHPFPFGIIDKLRDDFENRVWASADELEKLATLSVKEVKSGTETFYNIRLETISETELIAAKKAILPEFNSLEVVKKETIITNEP